MQEAQDGVRQADRVDRVQHGGHRAVISEAVLVALHFLLGSDRHLVQHGEAGEQLDDDGAVALDLLHGIVDQRERCEVGQRVQPVDACDTLDVVAVCDQVLQRQAQVVQRLEGGHEVVRYVELYRVSQMQSVLFFQGEQPLPHV